MPLENPPGAMDSHAMGERESNAASGTPFRKRVWEIVEVAQPGDRASRAFDIFILALIFLNVLAVMAGTIESVQESHGRLLDLFEDFSVAVFSAEYLSRIWSCVTDARYRSPIAGRLRFAVRPMIVVDFLAILPYFLPMLGLDLRFIRTLRLMRIFRIAKMGRYSKSLQLISSVLKAKKEELIMAVGFMVTLIVLAASLVYYCEHEAQPGLFSSIPASLWWAVITLSSVGYGDMYPVTVAGKVVAAIIAVLGIGMVALPAGILGSGFIEALNPRQEKSEACPHCGKLLQ